MGFSCGWCFGKGTVLGKLKNSVDQRNQKAFPQWDQSLLDSYSVINQSEFVEERCNIPSVPKKNMQPSSSVSL